MWGAEPWKKWDANKGIDGSCFTRKRDEHWRSQQAYTFFQQALAGTHCGTNWYEGNAGALGDAHTIPTFKHPAPALLGFDEAIDDYCSQMGGRGVHGHAEACIQANLNILSLYADRVPYNICRNFEWQICAAQGRIPGQGGRTLIFSKAPKELDFFASPRLGHCKGWSPINCERDNGYATDSIFFLEICLYSEVCSNRRELFDLEVGQPWECVFDEQAFWQLSQILQESAG